MTTAKKITQNEIRTFLKDKLSNNDTWAKRALLKIYEFQTADEQAHGDTYNLNGVGFTGTDGHILSSFAEFLKKRGYLSPKQMVILKKKMHKYWKQILKISDRTVLDSLILNARNA